MCYAIFFVLFVAIIVALTQKGILWDSIKHFIIAPVLGFITGIVAWVFGCILIPGNELFSLTGFTACQFVSHVSFQYFAHKMP